MALRGKSELQLAVLVAAALTSRADERWGSGHGVSSSCGQEEISTDVAPCFGSRLRVNDGGGDGSFGGYG